ncbi:MAG: ComF family protein [Proteobacteria bacterium]|nr:ComF family protein [Pseudomonadota bacterium]
MFIETLDALKHLLWPTRCASCDILLPDPSRMVCDSCESSIEKAPSVSVPPNIDAACALFRYEGAVQSMVSKWKYHEDYTAQKAILSTISDYVEELRAFIPEGAVLIPVPPHPKRLRERGFDPVWTFGTKLHKVLENAGITVEFRDDVLIRTRHTAHQAGLSHDERMHNLDGAFKVAEGFEAKRVVLLDDVMTTGATASVCAEVLKRAGVEWVGFVALAHTVKQ